MRRLLMVFFLLLTAVLIADVLAYNLFGISLSGFLSDRLLVVFWLALLLIVLFMYRKKVVVKTVTLLILAGLVIAGTISFKNVFQFVFDVSGLGVLYHGNIPESPYRYEVTSTRNLNIYQNCTLYEKQIISVTPEFLFTDNIKTGLKRLSKVHFAEENKQIVSLLFYTFQKQLPYRIDFKKKTGEILSWQIDPESFKARVDSMNQVREWRFIKNNLYTDKLGELGFQTLQSLNEGKQMVHNYITTMYIPETDQYVPLKTLIDTATYEEVGETAYYKDKNRVYLFYALSDGGFLKIMEDADAATFHAVGACYAKDKERVYVQSEGELKNVDYATFRSSESVGCYAKDKHGYLY